MNPTGIKDCCISWPANQRMVFVVPCEVSPGRTLADWDSFTLTIREDPSWPRSGANLQAPLDPSQYGLTLQVTGVADASAATVTFDFTVPAGPGRNRYTFDVRGIGGDAGVVAFIESTWLTVTPSTM